MKIWKMLGRNSVLLEINIQIIFDDLFAIQTDNVSF